MPAITTEHRLLFEVELEPSLGERFQPTGFPDLGHALYDIPTSDGGTRRALLVESAQSMANRLEATGWDPISNAPVPTLDGLPHVRVVRAESGDYLTSSRTEAHRLASAFVKDSTLEGRSMREVIRERLGLQDDRPISVHQIAAAVFDLDPLCLVHGVFFAEDAKVWPGQPKVARALTGFVEAFDVEPAHSGGVKRDHVRHSISEGTGGTAEGYGSVPFHRTEWTAGRIVARFGIDRAQITSYGLDAARTELLEKIALWEIRSLLEGGLRLRTACDLFPVTDELVDQSTATVPSVAELDEQIRGLIGEIGHADPLEVEWSPERKGRKKKTEEADE
ncbi:MAG: type I-G CRISPR-associated RAMP protein Csb1/Cas7g [Acidimicrobiia bacterium]